MIPLLRPSGVSWYHDRPASEMGRIEDMVNEQDPSHSCGIPIAADIFNLGENPSGYTYMWQGGLSTESERQRVDIFGISSR